MTTPTTEIGGQYPQPDPRGWLVFAHLPKALQNAEDSTQAADRERWQGVFTSFTRPATVAERVLLSHLGHAVSDDLETTVSYPSDGVRRRRWISLEGNTTP